MECGRKTQRRDLYSSLGHAWQKAHAEVLVALACRHARRGFAVDLLDDLWRRVRPLSQASRCVRARRRRVSVYRWPRRARVSRATGLGRCGKQHKSPCVSCCGTTPARFYVDSLVHDADALALLLKLFGTQRVALGSDYPFPLGEAKPGELIESMKLSSEEKAQLLSGTAHEFLGL